MTPVDSQLRAQTELMLEQVDGCAVSPPDWRTADRVDYFYREHTVLARERDVERVRAAVISCLRSWQPSDSGTGTWQPTLREDDGAAGPVVELRRMIGGVVRMDYGWTNRQLPSVPQMLDRLDRSPEEGDPFRRGVGHGIARPEHVFYICGHSCPATEPEEVPGTAQPFPAPGVLACDPQPCPTWEDCDGSGVRVSVVDTGWLPEATSHSWLSTDVAGDVENPLGPDQRLREYAGHGTFSAGCLRVTAPEATIYVEGALVDAGAVYETDLVDQLQQALLKNPQVVLFCFAADTKDELSPYGFDGLFEARLEAMDQVAFLAPAGNDGGDTKMWPAAYEWVIGVGALSAADPRRKASFSNFGDWVDVFAPGEDLVNAFACGDFTCQWEPNVGDQRHFDGMARWSGTSFSTPLVAGLVAARTAATGETARQAADALVAFAQRQQVTGLGPVLYPGQACCSIEAIPPAGVLGEPSESTSVV